MHRDQATKDYVDRRISQGRTKKEIIRNLKRYITRQSQYLERSPRPTLCLRLMYDLAKRLPLWLMTLVFEATRRGSTYPFIQGMIRANFKTQPVMEPHAGAYPHLG
jgi:hypothetical protein